jgi:hypothetical protein
MISCILLFFLEIINIVVFVVQFSMANINKAQTDSSFREGYSFRFVIRIEDYFVDSFINKANYSCYFALFNYFIHFDNKVLNKEFYNYYYCYDCSSSVYIY